MSTVTPLISIILPTYNRSHTIKRAIDSVFNQTYKNHELIVIDDGSTDDTNTTISIYGDTIRYIRQANKGVSAARNAGIRIANGSYIAFIDSDDAWHVEKLQQQLKFFEDNKGSNLAMVCSDVSIVDKDGKRHERKWLHPKTSSTIMNFITVFKDPYLGLPTVMVKKECLNTDCVFDESLKTAEDIDMYLSIATRYATGYLHKKLVDVHVSEASLSSLPSSYEDNLTVLNKYKAVSHTKEFNRLFNHMMHTVYINYARTLLWHGKPELCREQIVHSFKHKISLEAVIIFIKAYIKSGLK